MPSLNNSAVEIVKSIKKGEITSEELVKSYIKEIKKKEKNVQAWEFFDEELVITQAMEIKEDEITENHFSWICKMFYLNDRN